MRTIAILPVKRFESAKQRLGASYAPEPRGDLARAMVRDVVAALAGSRLLERVVMVTADDDARALADGAGFDLVDEGTLAGHNAAADLGVAHALAHGAERVLLVPGDCPGLRSEDVDGILERHAGERVVIVPDRHGTGTNALLIAPPGAIAPAFGEGSCARHRALADDAGIACVIDPVATLGLDVDDADDVAALRAHGAAGPATSDALHRLAAGPA